MEQANNVELPVALVRVGVGVSEALMSVLPVDVAALAGLLWWLLALVFLLCLPIGWKLGARRR